MADNELTVVIADGSTKTLRDIELTTGVHAQGVLIWEGPEVPASTTGATVQHTVDDNPAVALDPPTAGARFARVRVYETSQDSTLRLYYRQDGTTVTSANATGYLLHGELILVKIADQTDFSMIAATGGVFNVYVEWLDAVSS